MSQNRRIVLMVAAVTAVLSMSLAGCGLTGGKKTVAVTTAEETTQEVVITTEVPTVAPTTVEETTEEPLESSLEETEEEEPLVLYTTAKVNLRAQPSTDADILTLIPLGTAVTVMEEGAEWHRVVYEGQEGFVSAEYVTADLDSASKAADEKTTKAKETTKKEKETTKKEKETTKKETEATRKETKEETEPTKKETKEETEPSKKETKEETEPTKKETKAAKKEVSRKRYDDPDGSGHGYWEITYDDGSTEIIEF